MAKRKVSLPVERLDEAHSWTGDCGLSAHVVKGGHHQVLADRRRQYLAELDDEFGLLTAEERAEGRYLWNGEA